jgi:hypothetical protein
MKGKEASASVCGDPGFAPLNPGYGGTRHIRAETRLRKAVARAASPSGAGSGTSSARSRPTVVTRPLVTASTTR